MISIRTIIYFCLALALVFSRMFLPEGPNYDGSKTTSFTYIGYLIEDAALGLISIVYLIKYQKGSSLNKIAALWLVFYLYAILTSPFSAAPVTSLHTSLRGVGYVFFGLLIFEYVTSQNTVYKDTKRIIYIIFFFLALSSVVETITTVSLEYVLNYGVGGSFSALIGLIAIFLMFDEFRSSGNGYSKLSVLAYNFFLVIIIICSLFVVILMNSLSSIICFLAGYCFLVLKNASLARMFILALVFVGAIFVIYPELEAGNIKIARKSLDTILEGTGRFHTWQACVHKISNGEMNPLGHGFMADQDLLNGDSSIELSHTCHNSFLTATVGLGYLGAAFYLFFCCFLFFQAVLAKGSHKIVDLVQLSLISMLLFGIASPMFPGMPTILVTLSILIYKIRNTKDEKSINYGI